MKREFADRAGLTAGDACHPVDPKRVPLGLLLSLLAPITLIPPARVQAAVPPNDSCTGAQVVVSTGPFPYSTIPVDITDATVAGGDPPLSNPDLVGKVAKSVWYRFTPAGNAVYTITSCSDAGTATTVADTILAVYRSSGGCSGPFTQVGMLGDEDCGPNGAQAAVTVTLAADTTYYIVAWSSTARWRHPTTPVPRPRPSCSTVRFPARPWAQRTTMS